MQDEPFTSPTPDPGAAPPLTPVQAIPSPPKAAPREADRDGTAAPAAAPAWAGDLRKLYEAVVAEPLPSNLLALLAQLDSED